MKRHLTVSLSLLALSWTSCADIDRGAIRASSEIPLSAQVEQLRIPRDSSVPQYAILVQQTWDQGSVTEWRSHQNTDIKGEGRVNDKLAVAGSAQVHTDRVVSITSIAPAERSRQLTAQLSSALSGVGNVMLISPAAVIARPNKLYAFTDASKMNGAKGPYILRARMTEYTAISDYEKSKLNVAVYKDELKKGRGIVAIDIELIDGATGVIVAAFPARSSFGYQDRKAGSGLLPIYQQRQYAQSALDQALRQATNDAAKQLWERLATQS